MQKYFLSDQSSESHLEVISPLLSIFFPQTCQTNGQKYNLKT